MIVSTSKAAAELMAGERAGGDDLVARAGVLARRRGVAMIAKLKTVAAVVVIAALACSGRRGRWRRSCRWTNSMRQWPVKLQGIFRRRRACSRRSKPRADAGKIQ